MISNREVSNSSEVYLISEKFNRRFLHGCTVDLNSLRDLERLFTWMELCHIIGREHSNGAKVFSFPPILIRCRVNYREFIASSVKETYNKNKLSSIHMLQLSNK